MNSNSKIIYFSLLILTLFGVSFAAEISTDKTIYNAGETMSVIIDDCQESFATTNIPNIWADQGTPSSGKWETNFVLPTAISTGSFFNVNGYCGEKLVTQICINPGCTISSEEDSSRRSSGGRSSGDSSSSGDEEVPPIYQPQTGPKSTTSDEEPQTQQDVEITNYDQEESNTMIYFIASFILIAILAGGFYLYKKKKATESSTGYYKYPNQNQPMNNQRMNNQPTNNQKLNDQNNNQY